MLKKSASPIRFLVVDFLVIPEISERYFLHNKKRTVPHFISQLTENALYAAANGRLRNPKTLFQFFLGSERRNVTKSILYRASILPALQNRETAKFAPTLQFPYTSISVPEIIDVLCCIPLRQVHRKSQFAFAQILLAYLHCLNAVFAVRLPVFVVNSDLNFIGVLRSLLAARYWCKKRSCS